MSPLQKVNLTAKKRSAQRILRNWKKIFKIFLTSLQNLKVFLRFLGGLPSAARQGRCRGEKGFCGRVINQNRVTKKVPALRRELPYLFLRGKTLPTFPSWDSKLPKLFQPARDRASTPVDRVPNQRESPRCLCWRGHAGRLESFSSFGVKLVSWILCGKNLRGGDRFSRVIRYRELLDNFVISQHRVKSGHPASKATP